MKDKLLSFPEFEKLYESYGFIAEAEQPIVPKATSSQSIVIDQETNTPKDADDPLAALLASFSNLDAKEEKKSGSEEKEAAKTVDEAEEKTASEPGKKDKSATATKAKKIKVIPTPLVKALSLRNCKKGESSERVKVIQKKLGLEPTGTFDQKTKEAVEKFQEANGLLKDGIVGVQTYGALIQIKDGESDLEKIQKLIEQFAKLTPTIVMDPRFYGLAQSITIVTINNITYVVVVPDPKCKPRLEEIKKQGLLSSGYEWLTNFASAIGKALVYTTVGLMVVPLAVATAIVSAGIAVMKEAAKGLVNVVSAIASGMQQLANWAAKGLTAIWATVKTAASDASRLLVGFAKTAVAVVATVAKGCVALAGALVQGSLVLGASVVAAVWAVLKVGAKVMEKVWSGIEAGADALKQAFQEGMKFLGSAAKSMLDVAKTAYREINQSAIKYGQALEAGVKETVKGAVKFIGNTIEKTGEMIADAGRWITSLVSEAYEETGDPLFEKLLLQIAD